MRFVNSVIDVFQSEEHDTMIPNYLFNYLESKPIVLKVVLFWNENESIQTTVKEIEVFHQRKEIFWKIKKIRLLFTLKKKNPYPSRTIYEEVCF